MAERTPSCPTPCDPDCELGADGCHEEHQPKWKRGHQPWACQAIREVVAAARRDALTEFAAEIEARCNQVQAGERSRTYFVIARLAREKAGKP